MIGPQGPVGVFAGETLGTNVLVGAVFAPPGAARSPPPETDLFVLPIVPPVEPACASTIGGTSGKERIGSEEYAVDDAAISVEAEASHNICQLFDVMIRHFPK
jgi:hypothetical protein